SEADLKTLLLPDLSLVAERLPRWAEQWDRDVVPQAD
ncbi:ABC transporter substrate-binding protein, partial [Rhizobium ruizarguesonis]